MEKKEIGKETKVKHMRMGCIEVTIWENENGTRIYKNATLQKNYKDKDGNWRKTGSLKANDIPKAIVVLEKAYEDMVSSRSDVRGV